jgi:hypothetical protein
LSGDKLSYFNITILQEKSNSIINQNILEDSKLLSISDTIYNVVGIFALYRIL